ncbi:MAG: class I SAM-dependent methyltransferase [Acutalibacteraceae bacterium]|nr:class I SAM-dependent methyltransferase [Acutalibacteraceae bacterium]
MNSVNKTLYIPLYGKAYVSKKGIILNDEKAEEIWSKEGFELKGKSKSKWLAYYMGMRASVYDSWLTEKMKELRDAVIIHIGCGMDGRVIRVGTNNHSWYDVDFAEVIEERRLHYVEDEYYKMLEGDARNPEWLSEIPKSHSAIVVIEGTSMYLKTEEVINLISVINNYFDKVALMIDFYTTLSAKISKYKNPINDVGVTEVYGTDNPELFELDDFKFIKEHNMTPDNLINELTGIEKHIFKKIYGGKFSKKMYRLFEYSSI